MFGWLWKKSAPTEEKPLDPRAEIENINLIPMLDMDMKAVLKSSLVRAFDPNAKIESFPWVPDFPFIVVKEAGIEFAGDSQRRVNAVILYAEGHETNRPFTGAIPEGVQFSDSREAVRQRLGEPSQSGEAFASSKLGRLCFDRYERPQYAIRLEYFEGNASIRMVQLIRPDAAPK